MTNTRDDDPRDNPKDPETRRAEMAAEIELAAQFQSACTEAYGRGYAAVPDDDRTTDATLMEQAEESLLQHSRNAQNAPDTAWDIERHYDLGMIDHLREFGVPDRLDIRNRKQLSRRADGSIKIDGFPDQD